MNDRSAQFVDRFVQPVEGTVFVKRRRVTSLGSLYNFPLAPEHAARLLMRAKARVRALAFNPNQARDKDGQWTDGGTDEVSVETPPFSSTIRKLLQPEAARRIKVRNAIFLSSGTLDEHIDYVKDRVQAAGFSYENGTSLDDEDFELLGAELQFSKGDRWLNVYIRTDGRSTVITADETPMDTVGGSGPGGLHNDPLYIPSFLREALMRLHGANDRRADAQARVRALRAATNRALGDLPGHPFRGNQWTDADIQQGVVTIEKVFSHKNDTKWDGANGYYGDQPVRLSERQVEGLQTFSIDELIPAQSRDEPGGFDPQSLIYHRSNPDAFISDDRPPIIHQYEGKLFIADGHHRIAAAALRGEKTVKVKVTTYEPKPRPRQTLADKRRLKRRALGDHPGHPFRGNQWTTGDSGFLTKDGQRVTAFHGTPDSELTVADLDPEAAIEVGGATFFTTDADTAWQYTSPREYGEMVGESSENILEAQFQMSNPMVVDMDGDVGEAIRLGELVREAKAKGHDGLILENIDDTVDGSGGRHTTIAVFKKSQIRPGRGQLSLLAQRALGDLPGHPFRGNQWTGSYPKGHPGYTALPSRRKLSDKQITPEVAAKLRRAIGNMPVQDAIERLFRTVPGNLDVTIDENSGGALQFYAKDARTGVEITRSFKWSAGGRLIADHEFFEMPPEMQGYGIAKTVMQDQMALYKELGVVEIHLRAELSGGGYAWAKYGFTALSPRGLAADLIDRVPTMLESFSPAAKRLTSLIKSNADNPKLPWIIAGVHDGENHIGKTLLRGAKWPGSLSLSDSEAMERFNYYVNSPSTPPVAAPRRRRRAAEERPSWLEVDLLGADDYPDPYRGELRTLGDLPGHPFRGNQYTDGQLAADSSVNLTGEAKASTSAYMVKMYRKELRESSTEGDKQYRREAIRDMRDDARAVAARLQREVPGSQKFVSNEDDNALVASEGVLRVVNPSTHVDFIIDRVGACHQNSAGAWLKDQETYDLMTGFYSRSGRWLSHSWLENKKTGRVTETTGNRMTHYFGVRLTGERAKAFARAQLTETRGPGMKG